jgi:predicted 3-demethylubiquinone-9 3-methyltransferase (glyoxalase superfamily)
MRLGTGCGRNGSVILVRSSWGRSQAPIADDGLPDRNHIGGFAMTSITPFLWFDGTAEEAANFYTSVLPDSHVDSVDRSPADNPSVKEGEVLTVNFTLAGRPFIALNGGPDFRFTEAISFMIECKDQAEVDRYWDALTANGGEPGPCGWLKDRFGLSWQVVPQRMNEFLSSPDRDGAKRAMEAMLKMGKLDVAALEAAFEGVPVGSR